MDNEMETGECSSWKVKGVKVRVENQRGQSNVGFGLQKGVVLERKSARTE